MEGLRGYWWYVYCSSLWATAEYCKPSLQPNWAPCWNAGIGLELTLNPSQLQGGLELTLNPTKPQTLHNFNGLRHLSLHCLLRAFLSVGQTWTWWHAKQQNSQIFIVHLLRPHRLRSSKTMQQMCPRLHTHFTLFTPLSSCIYTRSLGAKGLVLECKVAEPQNQNPTV